MITNYKYSGFGTIPWVGWALKNPKYPPGCVPGAGIAKMAADAKRERFRRQYPGLAAMFDDSERMGDTRLEVFKSAAYRRYEHWCRTGVLCDPPDIVSNVDSFKSAADIEHSALTNTVKPEHFMLGRFDPRYNYARFGDRLGRTFMPSGHIDPNMTPSQQTAAFNYQKALMRDPERNGKPLLNFSAKPQWVNELPYVGKMFSGASFYNPFTRSALIDASNKDFWVGHEAAHHRDFSGMTWPEWLTNVATYLPMPTRRMATEARAGAHQEALNSYLPQDAQYSIEDIRKQHDDYIKGIADRSIFNSQNWPWPFRTRNNPVLDRYQK